ncbi:PREDICTED: uncharacterized protein LOC109591073 [Amphimedon queenslandica]|uniref:Uncharacterized protein n=2 Tax=Amphimedon queenslandica TaxID=400682 RepID=A0AAN0JZA6_AMPQE|nr:PREDICTED: uncharacterized protein LOC109591073 [Amphimedon queenslandica]|eukprot:XP_019862443.1 PREDICTED: uncharacterized protein LOC109591073 [Amphimedon queenslandica]
MFSYVRDFPDQNSVSTLTYKRYIKIVGSTLLNKMSKTTSTYKYTRSWQKTVTVFQAKYSFFIYVGTLDLTLSGQISGQMNFNAFIGRLDNDVNMKASAKLETVPTLTVKGEATARVLINYKLGIEVCAFISYTINPEASTSLCGSSSQDANACFEVYGITQGNISVYAYWQSRKIRCRRFKCKKSWGGKKKFSKLSHTWSLANRREKLFGLCYACNCTGSHPLNVLCKGSRYGASQCSCLETCVSK